MLKNKCFGRRAPHGGVFGNLADPYSDVTTEAQPDIDQCLHEGTSRLEFDVLHSLACNAQFDVKVFREGVRHSDGSVWIPDSDSCNTCSCSRNQVTCQPVVCPDLPCDHPVSLPDECCPYCPCKLLFLSDCWTKCIYPIASVEYLYIVVSVVL